MFRGQKFVNLLILYFIPNTFPAISGQYAWCGPYDTFCIFSLLDKTNLSGVQMKCDVIKNDSRPVVPGDDRVNEVAKEFIRNHSIHNIICHTFLQKGVEEKEDFGKKSMDLVICMTNCQADWTNMDQKAMDGANMTHHSNIKTIQECKALCEVNISCSSIDWIHGTNMRGCWLNKYPYNASKLYENSKASHHVVDRTVKTVDRCIGKGFVTLPPDKPAPTQINIVYLVSWTLIAMLTASLILVSFLYWKSARKYLLRKPNQIIITEEKEDKTFASTGSRTMKESNSNKAEKEPLRYDGPHGDIYTSIVVT